MNVFFSKTVTLGQSMPISQACLHWRCQFFPFHPQSFSDNLCHLQPVEVQLYLLCVLIQVSGSRDLKCKSLAGIKWSKTKLLHLRICLLGNPNCDMGSYKKLYYRWIKVRHVNEKFPWQFKSWLSSRFGSKALTTATYNPNTKAYFYQKQKKKSV